MQAVFPQANKIEMFPLGGFAVLYYEVVDDCKLDKKNATGAQLKDRKLRVIFRYKNEGAPAKAAATPAPQVNDEPSTSFVFVKNLGRNTTEEQVSEKFKCARIVSMPLKGKACRG